MSDITYKRTAFVLVKAPSKIISSHLPKSKKEHQSLLRKAKENGYYLYYAPAEARDGKYLIKEPWVLDWDSVPEIVEKEPELEPINELECPFCGKELRSTPGRTLHVKGHHPDRLEEYQAWLISLGKK